MRRIHDVLATLAILFVILSVANTFEARRDQAASAGVAAQADSTDDRVDFLFVRLNMWVDVTLKQLSDAFAEQAHAGRDRDACWEAIGLLTRRLWFMAARTPSWSQTPPWLQPDPKRPVRDWPWGAR